VARPAKALPIVQIQRRSISGQWYDVIRLHAADVQVDVSALYARKQITLEHVHAPALVRPPIAAAASGATLLLPHALVRIASPAMS
jgi:hypothetical protein